MPKYKKRQKTSYPGVYYTERTVGVKTEKVFLIIYRKNGKQIEELAGYQYKHGMTPPKASNIRGQRMMGITPTRKEAKEITKAIKWTFQTLWETYRENKGDYKTARTDKSNYELHLKESFGSKMPLEVVPLDIDRLKRELEKKKGLKPQTVKHVLTLLARLNNYAMKRNLCESFKFSVERPSVDNVKTEDLNQEQLQKLLEVLDNDYDKQIANIMKLALYTGMRKGELLNLEWSDIDFDRGFILIREPKGGKSQKIPLNDPARRILVDHEKPFPESSFVFPGRTGEKRVDIKRQVQRIKRIAGLPEDFRPLHGLRHVFASTLASSGKVDMYTLQKLLTHKSPQMTQRYAHLRDETLKSASDLAGDLISGIGEKTKKINSL